MVDQTRSDEGKELEWREMQKGRGIYATQCKGRGKDCISKVRMCGVVCAEAKGPPVERRQHRVGMEQGREKRKDCMRDGLGRRDTHKVDVRVIPGKNKAKG